MNGLWEGTVTVQSGGRIEIQLPEFKPGDHVRVRIEREASKSAGFVFGLSAGKIKIREDFDESLEDFQDYS